MTFTNEQMTKAKQAKTAEELLEMAKASGIEMTEDEAKAMEIAQRNRFIHSYAFLRNMMSIQYSILSNGPVMICLPVYNTSRDTFWEYRIGEAIVGFHAVTVVGYNLNGFRLRNSWGTSYGRGGYADFPYTDFGRIREAWTIFS